MNRPTVTAVICTRHRPIDLRRALRSLEWQDESCTEVIVVDDADIERRSDTGDACAGIDAPIKILTKDTPGLTASRNLAIEHASGDLVMFIDDDVILRPDYVHHIVEAFANDPGLAGAGGTIDDDHDYELPRLRGLLMIPGRTTGRVYRSGWSSQSPRREDRDVDHLIGCNMVFRADVLSDQRFDDRFLGYALGEDLEFSYRLRRAGHRLRSVGAAHLWHLTSAPRHDWDWGYREVAIRPVVVGPKFNRAAFLLSAVTFACVNVVRNRERARGNMAAIQDVLLPGRARSSGHHVDPQTTRKEVLP